MTQAKKKPLPYVGAPTREPAWNRIAVGGVVRVERRPGPKTLQSRADAAARDAAVYELLMGSAGRPAMSAAEVGREIGKTRNSVLGASLRHRVRHGLPPQRVDESVAARRAAIVRDLSTAPLLEVADRHEVTPRTVRDADAYVRAVAARAVRGTATVLPFPVRERLVCDAAVDATSSPWAPVRRLSLVEVGHGQCRSLGGDGLCCSRPTAQGRAWCPGHRDLYTRQGRA